MTNQEKDDINALLGYLWRDEERHYQCGPCKDHIFVILKRLAKGIGYQVAK